MVAIKLSSMGFYAGFKKKVASLSVLVEIFFNPFI